MSILRRLRWQAEPDRGRILSKLQFEQFRDVSGDAHAGGQTRGIDPDEIDERRIRAFESNREVRFISRRRALWAQAKISPFQIFIANVRNKPASSVEKYGFSGRL